MGSHVKLVPIHMGPHLLGLMQRRKPEKDDSEFLLDSQYSVFIYLCICDL